MEIFIVTWNGEEDWGALGAFSRLDKAKAACAPALIDAWDQFGNCWRGDTKGGYYFIVRGQVDAVLPAY
jgi:hypothetical protein